MQIQDISSVLHSLKNDYNYDFLDYKLNVLERRFAAYLENTGKKSISDIIHNRELFHGLVDKLTINVTEIFRDPETYKFIRDKIAPHLHAFPRVKIWSAGCSTGEEPYSLAILLKEAGLLQKSHIYATDISSGAIASAKEGIFRFSEFEKYLQNYNKFGGQNDLSDYFFSGYGKVIFSEELRKKISFFKHNVVSDSGFIEAQLIMCSNVLIYFNENLQKKVIQLFYNSMGNYGFLVLGMKERVPEDLMGMYFEKITSELPIYRKVL